MRRKQLLWRRFIRSLSLQILVFGVCVATFYHWAINFPYPSPVVKELLPPKMRWPTQQVADWVKSGNIDNEFLSFFYRDPERVIPSGDVIVAPADGRIVDISDVGQFKHIVIALSFWDVHVQRSPLSGVVERIEDAGDTLMDGEGRDLAFLKGKRSPVQKIIHIKSDRGLFKVRLVTSLLARRIEVWPEVGSNIEKGERLGLIHLGSTVVVDVPRALKPIVNMGDVVVAGETVIIK